MINSQRKVFAISGLTPILDASKKFDVGIRTDFKSLKFTSDLNRTKFVAYTKDTNTLLEQNGYAVKLSQEAGKAYFMPINAFQVASFVDEKDRLTKSLEDHNDIVQDVSELPHPSRNKFNQLSIEMRHYLYKPLKVIPAAAQRQYLNQVFTTSGKSNMNDNDEMIPKTINETVKPKIDMLKCDYSRMVRVNFLDIKQIVNEEMRAEAFMRKAQLASFYEIFSILGVEQQTLLNCLQTYSHLVCGNWVIKSNLLYKTTIYDDDSRKKHLEDLINLRESLLYCFVTNKRVLFSQIYHKFKVSLFCFFCLFFYRNSFSNLFFSKNSLLSLNTEIARS